MAFTRAYDFGEAMDLFYGGLQNMQNLVGQQTQAISNVPMEYLGVTQAYQKREQDLRGMLSGYGDVQREQLAKDYEATKAKKVQELTNRGMYNSSAYEAAMRGLETDYQSNLRALNDQLNRTAMGYATEWSGDVMRSAEKIPQAKMDVAQQSFNMGREAPLMQERLGQYKTAMINDISGAYGGLGVTSPLAQNVSSVSRPGGGGSGGGGGAMAGGRQGGGGGGGGTGSFLNPTGGYYDMFAGAAAQNSLNNMYGTGTQTTNPYYQPRDDEKQPGEVQENPYASGQASTKKTWREIYNAMAGEAGSSGNRRADNDALLAKVSAAYRAQA